ncbi:hypothetical protein [Polyangium jinanense]|uniref:Lipoprotein n=1 Tax=Polyangium jinanense TaxID=2829994 RepID=A0A9X4AUT2_9BACT|nr:hypothetical protein [Polyangium jinanense]MDC3957559.1 hypothetical protein [Polyangium jinanense]MDC3984951.1 hypothetical protein [Polyangium jinanense]
MKNVSKIVALILSASAAVWMTGCAAEVGDFEDTDSALANVEKGAGITGGNISAGQDSQLGENLPLGGEILRGVISKRMARGGEKAFEQGPGKGLQKGRLSKGLEQNLGKGFSKTAPIPAQEKAVEQPAQPEQPALGQEEESGQVAGVESIEESQVPGLEEIAGQEASGEEALSLAEEETGESQEALSSQYWRGRHRGWYGGYYGYGRHGHRYPYYGYYPRYPRYGHYPYYGGYYPYYGYPYYGGYPYYRHHRRYWW